jgi:hypothetical protein
MITFGPSTRLWRRWRPSARRSASRRRSPASRASSPRHQSRQTGRPGGQIVVSTGEGVSVVPEVGEDVVTGGAHKTTNATAAGGWPSATRMVVIDGQTLPGTSRTTTDRTAATLELQQGRVLLRGDAVDRLDPPPMVGQPQLTLALVVVAVTAWARMGSRASHRQGQGRVLRLAVLAHLAHTGPLDDLRIGRLGAASVSHQGRICRVFWMASYPLAASARTLRPY